jgi:hypothetical protein
LNPSKRAAIGLATSSE